jgi:hypothetical protein
MDPVWNERCFNQRHRKCVYVGSLPSIVVSTVPDTNWDGQEHSRAVRIHERTMRNNELEQEIQRQPGPWACERYSQDVRCQTRPPKHHDGVKHHRVQPKPSRMHGAFVAETIKRTLEIT